MYTNEQLKTYATNIRKNIVKMVAGAKSGHPGIALSAAPMLYTLFANHMVYDINKPNWCNRDRFVMSAGHGSALLYAMLFMAGYDISIDDLVDFRKIGSKTPGHPEYGVTPGVEVSTGPLGQGFANAVGMALSEKYLAALIEEELPNNKVAVFSGPSHAEEVSRGVPTAMVVASQHEQVLSEVQKTFMNEKLRVYASCDIKGAELGGGLKNIIAFCAGAITGLNLGDNTFAALATRGLVEIARLGTKMGGEEKTFYGLTGLGDLIVTCSSEHSRNRRAGKLIGQGKTIEEARQEIGMVIESIDNIKIAYELSKKYNVEMPIITAIYNVLYNNLNPKDAVFKLMTRDMKYE